MQKGARIKTKSIKTNYVYNLLYEVFALLTPLITTPYISRVLEPAGTGTYSFTYSVAQIFVILGNLGVSIYGQMKIAECRDDRRAVSKIFYELFLLRLLTMALSLGVYYAVAFASENYRSARLILGMFVLASAFDFSWFFRGVENFSKVVLRDVVVKLFMIAMIFVFVKDKDDVNIYILLVSLSALIGNATYIISLARELCRVPIGELRIFCHFRGCMVYFIPTIATSVYTILDKTMLGVLTGTTLENGYYEQAHKIEQILLIIITSLNTIMRSRMTYLYAQGKFDEMRKRLDNSVAFILLVSVAMTAGMIGVADTFIPLFLGKGYAESVVLMKIFAFLLILIGLSNCLNTHFLGPSGRQRKNNVVLIGGACVNMLLNYISIPRFGAIGAACASVVAELFILIGYLFLSRDFFKADKLLKFGWHYAVAGAIMCLAVSRMNAMPVQAPYRLVIQMAAGGAIYATMLLAFRDKTLFDLIKQGASLIKTRV